MADLEWDGGECSECYGGGARGGVGEGDAGMILEAGRRKTVRFANTPPFRGKAAKGWGTRICGLIVILLMVGCRGQVEDARTVGDDY